MQKPVTGQYECLHRSAIGIDYFTSRIDRLVIQQNGRFTFTTQDSSRLAQAAKHLVNNQQVQVTGDAPQTKREGSYTLQGTDLALHFDDGAHQQGKFSWDGQGIQIGADFFNKVSDSTVLPSTQRMQKDMEDIAKGLKIAGTLGGMALKAAQTIHNTIQSSQESSTNQPQSSAPATPPPVQNQPNQATGQRRTPPPAAPAQPQPSQSSQPSQPQPAPEWEQATLFCDQCGSRVRPGKKFCNNCGALLP